MEKKDQGGFCWKSWLLGLAVGIGFVTGVAIIVGSLWKGPSLNVVVKTEAKRAEIRADVKSWECTIAQAEVHRALEQQRWAEPRKTLVAEKGKFRLIFERNSNPEFMTWHVTKLVTSQIILDFFSPDHKRAEQPPLARRLFEVDGVQKVYLYQHTITVKVSLAFDYEKVRADAERAILARYGIKIGT